MAIYAMPVFILSASALLFTLNFLPSFYWWKMVLKYDTAIPLKTLFFMQIRKVNLKTVIKAYGEAKKHGLNISLEECESAYTAGGNIIEVVNALILAQKTNVVLSYNKAIIIDLAGRDISAAVEEASSVVEVPYPLNNPFMEIEIKPLKKKIKLRAILKVKLNLEFLIGGAEMEALFVNLDSEIKAYAEKSGDTFNMEQLAGELMSKNITRGTKYHLVEIELTDRGIAPIPNNN